MFASVRLQDSAKAWDRLDAKVQGVDLSMRDITASDPAFHTALLARLIKGAACTPELPDAGQSFSRSNV